MFTRKEWFFLTPDDTGGGGDSSEDDKPSEDDTSFLDIDEKKKDSIADDDEEGLLASRSKSKSKSDSKKSDDKPSDDRPENIAEKFWDPDKKEIRVEALAKSHKDAESNLSRLRAEHKVPEFPEEYLDVFTFDVDGQMRYSDGIDRLPVISKKDPLLAGALESFHRRGLSVEQAAGVIKDVFKIMDGIYPAPFDNDAYVEEQNSLLGVNHEMQMDTAIAWIESLHTQGFLNLNEAKALHSGVGRSAHGVMALNKLRAEITGEPTIPIHEVIPSDGLPTQNELYAMKLRPEYKTDAKFREQVDKLFPLVFPGTGQADLGGLGMDAIRANDARKRQKKQES